MTHGGNSDAPFTLDLAFPAAVAQLCDVGHETMKITREDNHDLGFVLWCIGCEAISKDEFRKWVLHVIETVEDPPIYIFDLIDFDGYMTELHGIIGFTPDWSPTNSEINAISGIAIQRGVTPYEPVDPASCAKALARNPSVRSRFEELFPFIQIESQQDQSP